MEPGRAEPARDDVPRRPTTLRPRHGKMVTEALPKIASKATALRTLWRRAGDEFDGETFGEVEGAVVELEIGGGGGGRVEG